MDDDKIYNIDGHHYKFGRFGLVYYLSHDGDWNRSTLEPHKLRTFKMPYFENKKLSNEPLVNHVGCKLTIKRFSPR